MQVTATPFQYANWFKYEGLSETRWANCYAAACHFAKKEELVEEMRALRTLELAAVKTGIDSDTQKALEYLKGLMVAVNRKIIAANRKSEREGWGSMSDSLMQKHIAGYKGL